MKRATAIDIGTNSVKFSVGELRGNAVTVVGEGSTVTRLGASVDKTGLIQSENADRTLKAIREFFKNALTAESQSTVCVGTSALRDAKNGAEFIKRVKDECGVDVEVITGVREAELAYKSIIYDRNIVPVLPESITIFDVGGGSSELVYGRNNGVVQTVSLNVGAVRLTDRHFKSMPARREDVREVADTVTNELERSEFVRDSAILFGIGGTAVTVAALKYAIPYDEPMKLSGCRVQEEDLRQLSMRLQTMTVDEIKNIPCMDSARADIILAGALILNSVLSYFNAKEYVVSTKGVRFGLLCEALIQSDPT